MSEYKRFWVDISGEYYRFKESDILPDRTLSEDVPDFVKKLYAQDRLEVTRRGVGNYNLLAYYKDDVSLPDVINDGDSIIQESYEHEDVIVIPREIFDKLFHGED